MAGVDNRLRLAVTDRASSLADHYRLAAGIRAFERMLLDQFALGGIGGTTHTCIGQEVTAVAVTAALDRTRDCVFSNHRGHGHFLAYCGEVLPLLAEIFGRPDGVSGGRGGSQHLHWRNFYSNGIQGGSIGNAVGVALAEKTKRSGAVTCAWLGDGTFGEGLVCVHRATLCQPIAALAKRNPRVKPIFNRPPSTTDTNGRTSATRIRSPPE